jgi:dTDP-4-dehydrorhamnose reductase
VINCIAVPRASWNDPLKMISVFGLFPKRLAHLCAERGIRLIHVSSDGVFRGTRGRYAEDDLPDANDLYGISKILGEVSGPLAVTLRTSIVGHELQSKSGLLEWFLSQKEECRCYANALFSGLPSVVFAQVVRDIVLPRPQLHGIYHVAARGISKCDLLRLIAARYGCSTRVIPDQNVAIDRTLRADRFASATGYEAPEWPVLVDAMYSYKFGLRGDG